MQKPSSEGRCGRELGRLDPVLLGDFSICSAVTSSHAALQPCSPAVCCLCSSSSVGLLITIKAIVLFTTPVSPTLAHSLGRLDWLQECKLPNMLAISRL